jgi:hypothetical protein
MGSTPKILKFNRRHLQLQQVQVNGDEQDLKNTNKLNTTDTTDTTEKKKIVYQTKNVYRVYLR